MRQMQDTPSPAVHALPSEGQTFGEAHFRPMLLSVQHSFAGSMHLLLHLTLPLGQTAWQAALNAPSGGQAGKDLLRMLCQAVGALLPSQLFSYRQQSSGSSSGSSSSSLHGTHCLPGEARTHHTSLHQQSK